MSMYVCIATQYKTKMLAHICGLPVSVLYLTISQYLSSTMLLISAVDCNGHYIRVSGFDC